MLVSSKRLPLSSSLPRGSRCSTRCSTMPLARAVRARLDLRSRSLLQSSDTSVRGHRFSQRASNLYTISGNSRHADGIYGLAAAVRWLGRFVRVIGFWDFRRISRIVCWIKVSAFRHDDVWTILFPTGKENRILWNPIFTIKLVSLWIDIVSNYGERLYLLSDQFLVNWHKFSQLSAFTMFYVKSVVML